jgi:hypothetical protein
MNKPLSNIKVYDLEESLIASGYPMRTTAEMREVEDKDWKRGRNLTKASNGNNAHGQWLTGVRVAFDMTFSNKGWVEAERYRFLEFVSSQSTMHRITKFDIRRQYNEYVDPRVIEIMEEKVAVYNAWVDEPDVIMNDYGITKEEYNERLKVKYLEILYTNPAGFTLTARMTTDYRCLLNMYVQRHDHLLPEWRLLCEQLLELPHFKELVEAYYSGGIHKDNFFEGER